MASQRAKDLADQIDALVHDLQQELATPTPDMETIATVDALVKALATGGTYKVAAGTYRGNFVQSKPVTLIGQGEVWLEPGDLLPPTLIVKVGGGTVFNSIGIKNGAPDRECVVVGDYNATDAKTQPDGVTFRNCTLPAGVGGGHRAFALHGANISVIGSRVTNYWEKGRESQAVWIHNGPGPYMIDNNYLEASGENIMTGGDSIKIPNCVPTDVTIRGNTCFKPDVWRTSGVLVKNNIEVKNGQRVLIENNICDGNWRSGQIGVPIVLTVRNQNGDTPWAIVDDVVVRGNTTRRCTDAAAVSILGYDNNYPSQQTQKMLVEHNLFSDSPAGFMIGNGVAAALILRNNTLPNAKVSFLQFNDTRADATTPPDLLKAVKSPLTFVENIVKSGSYGCTGTSQTVGAPAVNAYCILVQWAGNVIEKTPERAIAYPNPAQNYLVEPGSLVNILEPAPSYKLKPGQAYGNAGY